MNEEVFILMATYNGQKYLEEQINSIINQTFKAWKLVIRDDNSSDNTFSIIDKYVKLDSRVSLAEGSTDRKGACQNFSLLLEHAINANYIMFSDQDDVWNKDKIECELNIIKKTEKLYSKHTPIVVYTNYLISDKNLEQKYIAYRNEHRCTTYKLLIANWVMGCSMIINNHMLHLSLSIPKEADNHDQWISILACMCGKIVYYSKPTFIHRIHADNLTVNQNTGTLTNKFNRFKYYIKNANKEIEKHKIFCRVLEDRIKKICVNNKELISFAHMLNLKNVDSIKFSISKKIYAVNYKLTLLLYIQLLIKK